MRDLPNGAKAFLWLVYLLAIFCVGTLVVFCPPSAQHGPWETLLFVVLGLLAGGKKIHLTRKLAATEAGSLSLGFAIVFMAILHIGPLAGLWVGSAVSLSNGLFPKRQPLHQLAFNLSVAIVDAWVASLLLMDLNHGRLTYNVHSFPAISAACLSYFLVNTLSVATIIGLCTKGKPLTIWKETFLWTGPSYFAAASASFLLMWWLGDDVGSVMLFGAPIAYITYQSYAVYSNKASEKVQHIEELESGKAKLADLYLATIKSLALAIAAKDQYTHQHILRVQHYAVATAKAMGLEGPELEGLNTGALLHDIGKLGVPEYVLLKPGRLTDEEFEKIKMHPEIGAAILDPVEFPWPVLPVVKHHHESWDGTGYPSGLKGEEIPLTARILSVADVYDALTSERSYRSKWTHERAVDYLRLNAGIQFDPRVVIAFCMVIDDVRSDFVVAAELESSADVAGKTLGLTSAKAAQAAQAIQRASSELWALYEVAQTLSTSLGLRETLDILAGKLEAILTGTACLFLLKDPETSELAIRTSVGVNKGFFETGRAYNLSSMSFQVLQSGESYLGAYDKDDLLLTTPIMAEWTDLRSALIVPIIHKGEPLGTINLYHPQMDAFEQADRQLLELIAERSAMAIYNGILFDRTRSNANTDPLTGLHNLRYISEAVADLCSSADRTIDKFSLLCLDVDSFKPINDNFGHQKGDDVLRDLAEIFKGLVRKVDIVARHGGDEFLMLLAGSGPAEAERLMLRLQGSVEDYDPKLRHEKLGDLRLGVSVGYSCFPADGEDFAALTSAADLRMYENKSEHKLTSLAGRGPHGPHPPIMVDDRSRRAA